MSDLVAGRRGTQGRETKMTFREWLEDWLNAYPDEVFIEPPPGKHGKTVDACSARALRFCLRKTIAEFDRRFKGPVLQSGSGGYWWIEKEEQGDK